MRAVIVYESMYGNTHTVAECVAAGLGDHVDILVVSLHEALPALLSVADLVVVGGPTHAHSLSSSQTRKNAAEATAKPGSTLHLDPDAEGDGLRDWFKDLADGGGRAAAAYDTRLDASPMLTGRASKGIAKRLGQHGYRLVDEPESFLVDKVPALLPGEAARAEDWGRRLAALVVPAG
jgi:hypothetical protein